MEGIGKAPALFSSLSREKSQWPPPRRIPLTLGAQVRLIASLFDSTKQAKSEIQQDIGEETWDAEAPL
jgi:hypothetical protein